MRFVEAWGRRTLDAVGPGVWLQPRLGEQLLDDVSACIGEAEIAALEAHG